MPRGRAGTCVLPYGGTKRVNRRHNNTQGLKGTHGALCVARVSVKDFTFTTFRKRAA